MRRQGAGVSHGAGPHPHRPAGGRDLRVLGGGDRSSTPPSGAGFALPYGCRKGNCGTCKAQVLEGEVDLEIDSIYSLSDFERELRVHAALFGLRRVRHDHRDGGPRRLRSRGTAGPGGRLLGEVVEVRHLTADIRALVLDLDGELGVPGRPVRPPQRARDRRLALLLHGQPRRPHGTGWSSWSSSSPVGCSPACLDEPGGGGEAAPQRPPRVVLDPGPRAAAAHGRRRGRYGPAVGHAPGPGRAGRLPAGPLLLRRPHPGGSLPSGGDRRTPAHGSPTSSSFPPSRTSAR